MLWLLLIAVVIIVIVMALGGGSKPSKRKKVVPRAATNVHSGVRGRSARGADVDSEDLGIRFTVSYGAGDDSYDTSRPAANPHWLGPGDSFKIAGFTIQSPLTYAASSRDKEMRCSDPSQIAPWLDVRDGAQSGGLPYWPWYARLTPPQRHAYLTWLASGRGRLPPEDGFLFIYYYGLERRLLVDKQDVSLVLKEVQRLRGMHAVEAGNGRSWSFQHYSSSLLWFVVASSARSFSEKDVRHLAESTHSWRDESLQGALAWCATHERPCPAWLAMVVAGQMPGAVNSVVRKRVADEFERLFAARYREMVGDGILLKPSKRSAHVTYQPASNALTGQACEIPNVLGIKSQFNPLVEIWNGCVDDLRRLSKVAAEGLEDLTPEAWEALPPELRKGAEHPLTKRFTRIVADHSADGGCLIPARALADPLGFEQRDRFTASQSRRIAETAQHVGYAIEPDARLMVTSYKAHDPLSVFVWMYDEEPDQQRYAAATTMLRFGVAVAAADGDLADEELQVLEEEIARMFDLNEHERRRLDALRTLLIREGSDPSVIGKKIRDGLSASHRTVIGRLLIAIAAADGVIHPNERRVLRRCYRALGLEPIELDRALEELALPQADDLVSADGGAPGRAGEPIPERPSESEVTLDQAAIHRIMTETREVSAMLAQAMGAALMAPDVETQDESTAAVAIARPDPPPISIAEQERVASPPEAFAPFYEILISKERWPRSELEAVARDRGHMLTGVLEVVNDWAYDELGGALTYEDGDMVIIEMVLLSGRAS